MKEKNRKIEDERKEREHNGKKILKKYNEPFQE